MRRCVEYLHDLYMTLTLDLKVKIKGFLQWIRVRAITSLFFDIGIPYLTHECITMRRCVGYLHDLYMTLNFDLKVKIDYRVLT